MCLFLLDLLMVVNYIDWYIYFNIDFLTCIPGKTPFAYGVSYLYIVKFNLPKLC